MLHIKIFAYKIKAAVIFRFASIKIIANAQAKLVENAVKRGDEIVIPNKKYVPTNGFTINF